MRLLHIIGSPRGERSRSRNIATEFIKALQPSKVSELDVWASELPDLDGAMLESRYRLIRGLDVEAGFEDRWARLRQIVDHLLSFDLWVFSTPMWNLGLPYRLKQFVDLVIQPTMAFTNDADGQVTPHGSDKTAVLIGASALDIRPGGPMASLDFNLNHLEQCLRIYFGVPCVHQIRIAPTFDSESQVKAVMDASRQEAVMLARQLKHPSAGQG